MTAHMPCRDAAGMSPDAASVEGAYPTRRKDRGGQEIEEEDITAGKAVAVWVDHPQGARVCSACARTAGTGSPMNVVSPAIRNPAPRAVPK